MIYIFFKKFLFKGAWTRYLELKDGAGRDVDDAFFHSILGTGTVLFTKQVCKSEYSKKRSGKKCIIATTMWVVEVKFQQVFIRYGDCICRLSFFENGTFTALWLLPFNLAEGELERIVGKAIVAEPTKERDLLLKFAFKQSDKGAAYNPFVLIKLKSLFDPNTWRG